MLGESGTVADNGRPILREKKFTRALEVGTLGSNLTALHGSDGSAVGGFPAGTEGHPVASSPSVADTDGDGLDDTAEMIVGTNSAEADSDKDGISDGAEVDQGTNPLDGIQVTTGVIATVKTPGAPMTPNSDSFECYRRATPAY